MNVVCHVCGGYGVTLKPDLTNIENFASLVGGTKHKCVCCHGRGYVDAMPVTQWRADSQVLKIIATYEDES